MMKACENCGVLFDATKAEARRGYKRFCSSKCSAWSGTLARAAKMKNTAATRFWSRVAILAEDDCWEWAGAKQKQGYGILKIYGAAQLAHRVAFGLHSGAGLPQGLVCHTCDNPPCCNPAHLWEGDHQLNAQDMADKGRNKITRGIDSHLSKLSPDEVKAIRESHESPSVLADRYSITRGSVWRARTKQTWRHIL